MFKNYILQREFFVSNNKDKIINFYHIQGKIGSGAFGTVYRAKHKIFPHPTRVIKSISKKRVKNPKSIMRQVSIMTKLDHPQIIKIYETFQDDDHLYIVMDYCSGGELYARLADEVNFNESVARHIFRQMVNAIKYMHSSKVAHRDLKLENFLMEDKHSWNVVLIDFGLGCEWKNDMRKEMAQRKQNGLIGTPYYIAPEVVKKNYDQRCDIWSLGVLLYMMVTGTPAFEGGSTNEILDNVSKLKWTFDKQECQDLTPAIKDLISRMLKPENERITLEEVSNHRWMTMEEADLQKALKVDFKRLQEFSSFSKLKKVVATYIATHLSQRQIQQLKGLFQKIDKNQDGTISFDELHEFLKTGQPQKMSLAELKDMMDTVDTNCNSRIDYNEFVSLCLNEATLTNEAYLKYVFNSFDLNRNGSINRDEFSQILRSYCNDFRCNQELVDEIMNLNDTNKDGVIDFGEFREALMSIRNYKASEIDSGMKEEGTA